MTKTISHGIAQYRPGAAIAFPAFLFAGGIWLIFLSSGHPALVALLALAATCLGILLGFLFGIPRVNDGGPGGSTAASVTLKVNTNIEQISDWLTKILVGLTLTNLANLPHLFAQLSAYLASHGMREAASESAIVAVTVFFLVDGFLFGYLATRLYLTGAFLIADPSEVLGRLKPAFAGVSFDAEGKSDLSADAKAAAKEVVKLDRTTLANPDDLALWAKAQMGLGDAKKAAEGYTAAVNAAPDRADLRVERAVALERSGEPRDRVLRELEAAYSASGSDPRAMRRAAERLMWNYLYVPAPRGFSRAIEIATDYIQRRHPESARLWMYLGAAWGQKHTYLKKSGATPEALAECRQNSYNALKDAIALDGGLASAVSDMLDGSGADNDLVDFGDDPQFRQLVEAPAQA